MATATFLGLFLIVSACNAGIANADPCVAASTTSPGSTLTLLHIYSKCSPFPAAASASWLDIAAADTARVAYLASLLSKKSVPIASGQTLGQTGNYIVRAKLGTPGQLMFMVLDTSNDAAWIPCVGCTSCSSTLFSPNRSSTYKTLDCQSPKCAQVHNPTCTTAGVCLFNQSYGGDSSLAAALSSDTLRLAMDVIPGYGYGCMQAVSGKAIPPQGLLGLGRGPMSLLSQTGSLYQGVFSYCLPSFKSSYSGSLKLGWTGQPKGIPTTPLLLNPHRSSLYYVNLIGISVGKHLVTISPEALAFNPATGAGTIIDSGTVITRFVEPVYTAIRDQFRKRINGTISSLGAFDTCFTMPAKPAPITLHFTGLDLTLPMENTLIHSSSGSLACLAMAAAPSNLNSVLNIIANLQQQNYRLLFDVANSRLGIARELCH